MVKKDRLSGNLISNDGALLRYSPRALKIALRNASICLGCGLEKPESEMADEHVLPDWLIKHCELKNHKVQLPNRQSMSYTRDKVRFCRKCNSDFSRLFEEPISKVVKEGFKSVRELYGSTYGRNLLFSWMAFISAKRRIASALFSFDQDTRNTSEIFEDDAGIESLTWMLALSNAMRHPRRKEHNFCRYFLVGPAKPRQPKPIVFDVCHDPWSDTMSMGIGDTLLIANFSDGQPTNQSSLDFRTYQKHCPSSIGFRELHAVIAFERLAWQKRYYRLSEYDGRLLLTMDNAPLCRELNLPVKLLGEMILSYVGPILCSYQISDERFFEIVDGLRAGRGTFLHMRDDQPFYDLPSETDGEVSAKVYNERLKHLNLHGRNTDPILRAVLHENWTHG